MFAVSIAFGDSITYFTDIQEISGYNLVNKGFLYSRSIYSYDFKNYLENVENKPHRICSISFSEKKSKIEKIYTKLKNKYQNENRSTLRLIDSDKFRFNIYEKE